MILFSIQVVSTGECSEESRPQSPLWVIVRELINVQILGRQYFFKSIHLWNWVHLLWGWIVSCIFIWSYYSINFIHGIVRLLQSPRIMTLEGEQEEIECSAKASDSGLRGWASGPWAILKIITLTFSLLSCFTEWKIGWMKQYDINSIKVNKIPEEQASFPV